MAHLGKCERIGTWCPSCARWVYVGELAVGAHGEKGGAVEEKRDGADFVPRLIAGVGGLLVVALAVVVHRSVRVLDVIGAEERRQRAAHDGRVQDVAELRDLGEDQPRVPLRLDLVLVDPVVARLPQLRVPLGGEVRDGEPGRGSELDIEAGSVDHERTR